MGLFDSKEENNNKEYAKGIQEGKNGNIITDIVHELATDLMGKSIRDKGIDYGIEHRDEMRAADAKREEEKREWEAQREGQNNSSGNSGGGDGCYYAEQEGEQQKEQKSLAGSRGILRVSHPKNREYLKIVENGELWLYSRVIFENEEYYATYRCSCCRRTWELAEEWSRIKNSVDCEHGCSKKIRKNFFVYLLFGVIIFKKNTWGEGRLIKLEKARSFNSEGRWEEKGPCLHGPDGRLLTDF
jgi:hypothetical protein